MRRPHGAQSRKLQTAPRRLTICVCAQRFAWSWPVLSLSPPLRVLIGWLSAPGLVEAVCPQFEPNARRWGPFPPFSVGAARASLEQWRRRGNVVMIKSQDTLALARRAGRYRPRLRPTRTTARGSSAMVFETTVTGEQFANSGPRRRAATVAADGTQVPVADVEKEKGSKVMISGIAGT